MVEQVIDGGILIFFASLHKRKTMENNELIFSPSLFRFHFMRCNFRYQHSQKSSSTSPALANNRNTLRSDRNKIHQLHNVHAVQVNMKDLIVAFDTAAR